MSGLISDKHPKDMTPDELGGIPAVNVVDPVVFSFEKPAGTWWDVGPSGNIWVRAYRVPYYMRLDKALSAVYDRRFIPDTIILPPQDVDALKQSVAHMGAWLKGILEAVGPRLQYKGVTVITGDLLETPRIDAHHADSASRTRTFKLVSQSPDRTAGEHGA